VQALITEAAAFVVVGVYLLRNERV
jgi:hypothetical protein